VTPAGQRALLVAGCGYVGTEAGLRLSAQGKRVWGLRRNPSGLPPEIEPLEVDMNAPRLGEQLPRGIDGVAFTAAADGGSETAYRAVYLDALDALLSALEARTGSDRPDRIVFTSSTAVYGDAEGGWVDEQTEPAPESWRGSIMVEAEARVLGSSIRGVVLRLGGIYGPGRTRLLDSVRSGRARCPGGGPLWSNRIHRDDAAAAVVHLLDLPDPDPVYVGVDAEPAPLCEVYRWVAEQLGAPSPPVDDTLERDRSNKRCSSHGLQRSGFEFAFPSFREGYAQMIGDASK
jgi:nucleoside-diphosphate-sugar epimerase